jgi:hypothetical protein
VNSLEVKAFFRNLASEPDLTFFDASMETAACKRAHSRFRRVIVKHRPEFLEEYVDITLSSASLIDLELGAVKLFGNTPTIANGPALKIIQMCEVDAAGAAGNVSTIYRFVRSRKELLSSSYVSEPCVHLSGKKIVFPSSVSGIFRVYYVGTGIVDWANAAAQFVDNFADYHDLIAYYAYEEYAALDQAFPEAIAQKLSRLETEFAEHLSEGVVLDSDQVSCEANW